MSYAKLRVDLGQCDSIPYTNSTGGAQAAGTAVVINGKLGILLDDVDDGESTVALVEVPGPGIMINKAAVAFAEGEPVTWDVVDGEANADTVNNTQVGYAYADAAAGDAEVQTVLTNESGVA